MEILEIYVRSCNESERYNFSGWSIVAKLTYSIFWWSKLSYVRVLSKDVKFGSSWKMGLSKIAFKGMLKNHSKQRIVFACTVTPVFKTIWVFFLLLNKGPPSGLRRFLTTGSPLKMMKNAFYFTLIALFVLKIFTFLSWLFGYIGKRLDQKAKLNFKIYDFAGWTANNSNTRCPIYQEVKAVSQ